MGHLAWAAVIKEENYQAILSESAGSFDLAFLEAWIVENGEGYFIRDPSSPLDCCLFPESDFVKLYLFQGGDVDALFRPIIKI